MNLNKSLCLYHFALQGTRDSNKGRQLHKCTSASGVLGGSARWGHGPTNGSHQDGPYNRCRPNVICLNLARDEGKKFERWIIYNIDKENTQH